MIQIRLCWRNDIVHQEDALRFSDAWLEASPESRRTLDLMLNFTLEVYGPGSHWVETRGFPVKREKGR